MIEIRNIPPTPAATADLLSVVNKTCDSLDVPIQLSDIKDVSKIINKFNQKKPSATVLVDFTTISIKNKILSKVKEFNKTNTHNKFNSQHIGIPGPVVPIYITESLTAKTRKLFYLARQFANVHGYKFCWTTNGRVYMRKTDGGQHIHIKEENQLRQLNEATA
ncbi:unnamed protein product [Colias eurytheme]|nr:unnamed protein product [Colias eurytheme]